MNCVRQQLMKFRMAAFALTMLALFILIAAATLPLQAQTDPVKAEPLTTASWLQTGYNATHVGYNPLEKTLSTSNVSELTQTWLFQTNAEINVPTLTSGSTVYIDSSDGNLYAVNATTGKVIWTFSGTATGYAYGGTAQGMAISGSTIYVNCQIDNLGGGHAGVCAVGLTGKKAGKLLWSWAIYDDGGAVSSGPYNGPVVSNGVVVIGEADTASLRVGYIVGLNAKTGAQIWAIGNCGDGGAGGGGDNDCYAPTDYPAAVSGGLVYYGTFYPNDSNEGVCAVEITTGATAWCAPTGDSGSPVAVSGNTAYVNTFSGTVYAFNAKTGTQLWKVTGLDVGNSYNRPAVAKGVVYVGGTYYGQQYALAGKTGKLLWTGSGTNNFSSAPSVANGVVYAECNGTCALDASTGDLLWDSNFGGGTTSQPAIVNGTVYAVCGYNNLCAYNLP
ncbi:MAG: PQQ-binding-like beta-propeller repeat protein [Terriglobales bacterium]